MYFYILSADNKPVISGKCVLLKPHTVCSEVNKTQCFLVYLNNVEIHNEDLLNDWKSKYLKYNKAIGSNGISPNSEYCYMEFALGNFRGDYDFSITNTKY